MDDGWLMMDDGWWMKDSGNFNLNFEWNFDWNFEGNFDRNFDWNFDGNFDEGFNGMALLQFWMSLVYYIFCCFGFVFKQFTRFRVKLWIEKICLCEFSSSSMSDWMLGTGLDNTNMLLLTHYGNYNWLIEVGKRWGTGCYGQGSWEEEIFLLLL